MAGYNGSRHYGEGGNPGLRTGRLFEERLQFFQPPAPADAGYMRKEGANGGQRPADVGRAMPSVEPGGFVSAQDTMSLANGTRGRTGDRDYDDVAHHDRYSAKATGMGHARKGYGTDGLGSGNERDNYYQLDAVGRRPSAPPRSPGHVYCDEDTRGLHMMPTLTLPTSQRGASTWAPDDAGRGGDRPRHGLDRDASSGPRNDDSSRHRVHSRGDVHEGGVTGPPRGGASDRGLDELYEPGGMASDMVGGSHRRGGGDAGTATYGSNGGFAEMDRDRGWGQAAPPQRTPSQRSLSYGSDSGGSAGPDPSGSRAHTPPPNGPLPYYPAPSYHDGQQNGTEDEAPYSAGGLDGRRSPAPIRTPSGGGGQQPPSGSFPRTAQERTPPGAVPATRFPARTPSGSLGGGEAAYSGVGGQEEGVFRGEEQGHLDREPSRHGSQGQGPPVQGRSRRLSQGSDSSALSAMESRHGSRVPEWPAGVPDGRRGTARDPYGVAHTADEEGSRGRGRGEALSGPSRAPVYRDAFSKQGSDASSAAGGSTPLAAARPVAAAGMALASSQMPSASVAWPLLLAYESCLRLCLQAHHAPEADFFLERDCERLRRSFGLDRLLLRAPAEYGRHEGEADTEPPVDLLELVSGNGEFGGGAAGDDSSKEGASGACELQLQVLKARRSTAAATGLKRLFGGTAAPNVPEQLACTVRLSSWPKDRALRTAPGSSEPLSLTMSGDGESVVVELTDRDEFIGRTALSRANIRALVKTESEHSFKLLASSSGPCTAKIRLGLRLVEPLAGSGPRTPVAEAAAPPPTAGPTTDKMKDGLGAVSENMAFDILLRVALRSIGFRRRNLHLHGSWLWIVQTFKQSYSISDTYYQLRYLNHVTAPGVATPTCDCLELVLAHLMPLLDQRHAGALNNKERLLLESLIKKVDSLLVLIFESYKLLSEEAPSGLLDDAAALRQQHQQQQPRNGGGSENGNRAAGISSGTGGTCSGPGDVTKPLPGGRGGDDGCAAPVLPLAVRAYSLLHDILNPDVQRSLQAHFKRAARKRYARLAADAEVASDGGEEHAYNAMVSLCHAVLLEAQRDTQLHNVHILPSCVDLKQVTGCVYAEEIKARLTAFLAQFPPARPAKHVVELLHTVADVEYEMEEAGVCQNDVSALAIFGAHIKQWIVDAKGHLLDLCNQMANGTSGFLPSPAKGDSGWGKRTIRGPKGGAPTATVTGDTRGDAATAALYGVAAAPPPPGSLGSLSSSAPLANFVDVLQSHILGMLALLDPVLARWPRFALHLEAALCTVHRRSLDILEADASCHVPQFSSLLRTKSGAPGAAGGASKFASPEKKKSSPFAARKPAPAARFTMPAQLAVLLNSYKRLLEVLLPEIEGRLRRWTSSVALQLAEGGEGEDEPDGGAGAGRPLELFEETVMTLKAKYKAAIEGVVERLAQNFQANRATSLRVLLRDRNVLAGEGDAEKALVPLAGLIGETVRDLEAHLSTRVLVTVTRGLWNEMGKELLLCMDDLKENVTLGTRNSTTFAIEFVNRRFMDCLQSVAAQQLLARDLDPPQLIKEAVALLAPNKPGPLGDSFQLY
eukprot:jgi/Mesvir1/23607/Mv18290-RA.1